MFLSHRAIEKRQEATDAEQQTRTPRASAAIRQISGFVSFSVLRQRFSGAISKKRRQKKKPHGSKICSSAVRRSINARKRPMASSKHTLRQRKRPFLRFLVLYPFPCSGRGFRVQFRRKGDKKRSRTEAKYVPRPSDDR